MKEIWMTVDFLLETLITAVKTRHKVNRNDEKH